MKILAALMLVPALSIQDWKELPPPPKLPTEPILMAPAEYAAMLKLFETMQDLNAEANERANKYLEKYQECVAWKRT